MSNPLLTNNFTINKFTIFYSDLNKKVKIDSGSVASIEYVESILSKYITLTVKLIDTTSLASQAMYGMEKVELVFTDNYNQITFDFSEGSQNGPLYIYEIHDKEIIDKQKVFTIELCRGDAIDNYTLRVGSAFKGVTPSELANSILVGTLGSKKGIKTTDSINKLSFVAPNAKPYEVLTWARNKFVGKDQKGQKSGGDYISAGYFFFEDYYNYNFISLDSLSALTKPVYKFVTGTGTGSQDEVVRLSGVAMTSGLNLFNNFDKGYYAGRIDFFDVVNCEVNSVKYNIKDHYEKWNKLGGDSRLPKVYSEVLKDCQTRLMSVAYNDDLFLEDGKYKTNHRLTFEQVVSQSLTRYGTFTNQVMTANAYGNLGIIAGSMVSVDITDPDVKKDATYSGYYIVFGVHHIYSKKGGEGKLQTKLTLVRDSFGV